MLMTDQLLNIKGPFEGILGLGLPSTHAKEGLYKESRKPQGLQGGTEAETTSDVYTTRHSRAVGVFPIPDGAQRHGMHAASDDLTQIVVGASSLLAKPRPIITRRIAQEVEDNSGIVVKGFMEEAGIKRFSMCFRDGESGALRFGIPKQPNAHASIGRVHWGLDFQGVSVGDISAPVQFCGAGHKAKGQHTSCGAIPDSGTTAFMAPKEHLISLYETMCDQWERCKNNHTAMLKAQRNAKKAATDAYNMDPFHISAIPKAVIFQQLVFNCRHWMTKEEGLDELPTIYFHVGGAGHTKQTLKLDAWAYIIETHEKEFKYVYKNVPGFGKMPVGKDFTGRTQKVCSPAFSEMDYNTEQNGPVWILGTPVFYQYQVGYDLHAKPPAISFSDEPCGSCKEEAAFVSQQIHTGSSHKVSHKERTHRAKHARQPRQVLRPFRVPHMDLSQPL
jgi:hypothetical protein